MSMDKAKILNDKQQRQSLSGSKNAKGLNRNIRNVLAKPYSVFWPLADPESEAELTELIQSSFPAAKKLISADERACLRKMQGKKMKEARTALSLKIWENNPGSKELRNCLLLGVNDVARALEMDSVVSILISNEADPPILTRHLSTLAATRNVPHIVLQNLKGCIKDSLDFAALAVGFKKVVAEETNHFYRVHQKIDSVFKALAKKDMPDEFNRSVKSEEEELAKPSKAQTVFRCPQDIYLSRSSKNYRAFIPGKGMKEDSGSTVAQYLSLSGEESIPQNFSSDVSYTVLGSTSIDTYSELQMNKNAENNVPCLVPKSVAANDDFVSLVSDDKSEEDDMKSVKKSDSNRRPTKRYFTSLEPLRVKRIQGNPSKQRKKGKEK